MEFRGCEQRLVMGTVFCRPDCLCIAIFVKISSMALAELEIVLRAELAVVIAPVFLKPPKISQM